MQLAGRSCGLAAGRANGDGVFELNGVNAQRVIITGTRGAIWGQIDKGRLVVTDLNLDDNLAPQVSGADQIQWTPDPSVMIYSGKNIHFRFSGGKYRFSIVGSGIDVTAVGVGQASLVGDPDDVANAIAAFAKAGFDGIALSFLNYGDELGYFAQEVLPRLESLGIRESAAG